MEPQQQACNINPKLRLENCVGTKFLYAGKTVDSETLYKEKLYFPMGFWLEKQKMNLKVGKP
jgi:hypothetical protein